MRTFVWGWLIVILFWNQGQSQDTLKILSWNIQMLPRGVNGNGKAKRAKIIASQLMEKEYDVVVFQELFYKRSRKIIRQALLKKYPHQTAVLNKKAISLKTNGGVMLFSRYPIHEVHEIRFDKRTGPDRLSRKGALFVELNLNGKPIQIVGTHLQAFGKQEIMYHQYQQLYTQLLQPHARTGVPQIICGDFNTIKKLPAQLPTDLPKNFEGRIAKYEVMMQTLQASDGELEGEQQFTMDRPYNDLCKKRKEYRLLLDYFLLRPNLSNMTILKRQVQIMRHPWHKKYQDLSDHYGLEAIASGF